MRGMKPHRDGHDLAHAQAVGTSLPRDGTARQWWVLHREQGAAEIIHIAKNRYNIHAELQRDGFGDQTVDLIYHIPHEFCFLFRRTHVRNVRQVWEGGLRCRTMYWATVGSVIPIPSLSNPPWIRGAPQCGLLRLMVRISSRTSCGTRGRPGLPRWILHRQNRCHAVVNYKNGAVKGYLLYLKIRMGR